MTPESSDQAAKSTWDDSYVLRSTETLWGEPPVPYATRAAEMFAAKDAAFVLDMPCGDGRNIMPLLKKVGASHVAVGELSG